MANTEQLERIKSRLLIIRAQLDMEIDELDAAIERASEGCLHQDRTEITAMGAASRKFYCRDCGEVIEQPFEQVPEAGG